LNPLAKQLTNVSFANRVLPSSRAHEKRWGIVTVVTGYSIAFHNSFKCASEKCKKALMPLENLNCEYKKIQDANRHFFHVGRGICPK
jgi:hypothetical protein